MYNGNVVARREVKSHVQDKNYLSSSVEGVEWSSSLASKGEVPILLVALRIEDFGGETADVLGSLESSERLDIWCGGERAPPMRDCIWFPNLGRDAVDL